MSYTTHRTSLFALLSLALTFCPSATAKAGSIVYNIQNYAGLQDGYTVSGTITTDGTIGALTSANITAWSFSVTGPTSYQLWSQLAGTVTTIYGLTASATELILPAPTSGNFDLAGFQNSTSGSSLDYARNPPSSDLYRSTTPSYTFAWNDNVPVPPGLQLGGSDWILAMTNSSAVPEPATLTLALLCVACFVVVETRRKAIGANSLRRSH